MVDKGIDKAGIESAWQVLGGRLAVTAGSLAALASLLRDAPPQVAAARGALAWAAVLVVSKLGLAALCRAIDLDSRKPASGPKTEHTP